MFVKFGGLDDGEDRFYRRIGDDWPILAFAKSFEAGDDTQTAMFSLGHVRDPGISYRPTVLSPTENLSLLYMQKYPTLDKLVGHGPIYHCAQVFTTVSSTGTCCL